METKPNPLELRAGHLTMLFEPDTAFLRRVSAGPQEVIRCVYAAVRDRNWGTVPTQILRLEKNIGAEHFELQFEASCQQRDIDFHWTGTLRGTAEGTVTFYFDGEARSTFLRNRIGFCVLHPHTCAGLPVQAQATDGQSLEGRFPELVAPQIFGKPPFGNLSRFAHEYAPGCWARVEYQGDAFEMEDQRNWTDASFKTYCTPLALPFPVEIKAGTRIQQSVVFTVDPSAACHSPTSKWQLEGLRMPTEPSLRLPELGLGLASHITAVTPEEKQKLMELRLRHVRLDLRLSEEAWPEFLGQVAGCPLMPLELAIHLPPQGGERELKQLSEMLPQRTRRLLVFREGEPATSPESLRLAREHLGASGIPIGGGTNAHFCELNRAHALGHALPALGDFVTWPMTPQVHAFDNLSIMENLLGQAPTVNTARSFAGGKPLCISPITLKPRFNAVATAEGSTQADSLPAHVDPRQPTLLTAAWTLGSIAELAAAGVASATYFETLGWGGVMERATGSPLPHLFPSRPGMVYPVYHVFAWLAGYREAARLDLPPEMAASLCLFHEGAPDRVLIADLTGKGIDFTFRVPVRLARWLMLQEAAVVRECSADPQGRWYIGPYEVLCLDL